MIKALKKTRYGIPSLLAILVASGIAAATFTAVYVLTPTVQYPTSETDMESFNVASGYSFTKTKILDLALPEAYDLKYNLSGDSGDILSGESAIIIIDKDEDFATTGDQTTKTISALGGTVTFSNVSDTDGQVAQKITISATARDATLATVSWTSSNQSLSLATATTTLTVSMEPTKA